MVLRITYMILFVSLTSYGQDCDSLPELNSSVVEFAKGKVGKKVDRGECWDLIKYALDDVDAEWDGFENFGDIVDETTECLYPGDIIQFKKIKIRYKEGDMTYTESMYHHTAIILEVSNDNNDLVILHQNSAQHGRKVGESDLKIDTVVSGTLTFYRPTSKDLD